MSDEFLVRYCSPTLAGIKTGSLFSCPCRDKAELKGEVRKLNRRLVSKGLRVLPVKLDKGRALIYVYRPESLKRDFGKKPVKSLLEKMGYACASTDECVARLVKRLGSQGEFPHEIGLFLGYPAEDVEGFIKNKAEKCKCSGCWKVYGNEKAAEALFEKYRKCTDIYCRQWKNGKSIERLAVGV